MKGSRRRLGLFLSVAPTVAFILLFVFYPAVQASYNAFIFLKVAVPNPRNYEPVGLANFYALFARPDFVPSLRVSLIIGFGCTFLIVGLALVIALIANATFKGRSVYRALVMLPWAVGASVAAQEFRYMLLPALSPIAWALFLTGLIPSPETFNPLTNPDGAILSVVFTALWKHTPFVALIILAGLQSIPETLYEAARVDGAGSTRIFRTVTIPLLMPFINIGFLFAAVISGTVVDVIQVLTEGGPGISTQNMPFLLYKLYFIYWNFDIAGALSVFLLVYAILLLIPLVRGLLRYFVATEA